MAVFLATNVALLTGTDWEALAPAGAVPARTTAPPPSHAVELVEVWSHALADRGHPIALSSPNVAVLDGKRAVVVGDRSGHIYAFRLGTGRPVAGWPASTGGAPVDSTPSVAALTPGSPDDTVFVGAGDAAEPGVGGYEAFGPDGSRRWYVRVQNPPTDAQAGGASAVIASLAVGDLQGSADVVAPSVGQEEYALNAATGATLPGFPWFTADSGFSTPALADLYGKGQLDVIEGGDQTAGMAQWVQYSQGGHLRVISPTGTAGTSSPTGGLQCEYNADQVVESSPAVGPFLAHRQRGVVIGTGAYWKGASQTDTLLAFGTRCNLVWTAHLDGVTWSSPALADLAGNGRLEVVEGTDNRHGGGSVYALSGATGAVLWRQPVIGEVIGSVVTVDFGHGRQDVVAPTTSGAEILNGKNGHLVAILEVGVGLQNAPLITRDPNGTIGITVAGYNGYNQGVVEHWEMANRRGFAVDWSGAWPMFHHDPKLTGNSVAAFSNRVPHGPRPRLTPAGCQTPVRPNGYYELGSEGQVWAFGNVAACGSLPGQRAGTGVAGLAATPNGGGYWVANQEGQVFTFGDAPFLGPNYRLRTRSPVVALTATPDGRGYWLVTGNGRVFSFGDARFYGPRITLHLSAPIVGMAATAGGLGYWLVGQDGAIYNFGDAVARSSAATVQSGDIMAVAADRATGGYWLAGAGGQVWAFDAPFYGSIAGYGMAAAVTAMAPLPHGAGYRLVDSGGETFCYGGATDMGSASLFDPGQVVVAVAGP
jgi:hypothetical protein